MPIWLIKIKTVAQSILLWIKGNWLLLLISAGMLYALFLAKNKASMLEQLLEEFKDQQAQNKQQLENLRKVQQEQIAKQLEINAKYNQVLAHIQANYQEQLQTLNSEKEKDLKRIVATNKDDPSAMARDINILFGIPIYPTQE